MGSLLAMPLSVTNAADRPIHRRIRARSRLFALLFTFLLGAVTLLLAAAVAGVLLYTGDHVFAGPDGIDIILGSLPKTLPPDVILLGTISARFRIGGVFALIAQMAPAIMVLANLRGLFRLYAVGTVFGRENATRIKHIGLWLIAYAATPFLSVELLTLVDCVIDRAWFHLVEVQALVLGGILLVIAQVMEAGHEIEQDRDGFV
jgi:hypothetical protein